MAGYTHPRDIRPRFKDYLKILGIAAAFALLPALFIIGGQWWYLGFPTTAHAVIAQLMTYFGCVVVVLFFLAVLRPGKGLPTHFGV